MDASNTSLQDLIYHTKTIKWDEPSQLESLSKNQNTKHSVLIGKLLTLKLKIGNACYTWKNAQLSNLEKMARFDNWTFLINK
jgi:hypothetical protein